MEVHVIHPSLAEYHSRVQQIASKYGKDTWFALAHDERVMTEEDDRDEFAFIYSALGDQLVSYEVQLLSESEPHEENFAEPGNCPGSESWSGERFDREPICKLN